MGLITKEVTLKWYSGNKTYYEGKGYKYTSIGSDFIVRVEDLYIGSANVKVDCICANCGEVLKDIEWRYYVKRKNKNGDYYCQKCAIKLFGSKNANITKLKNSISFYDWCYENLPKEETDEIMLKWDYELNKCSPKEVGYGSSGLNGKGYWFKCLKDSNHKSEQRHTIYLTNKQSNNVDCYQCSSIGVICPDIIKYLNNTEDAYKYTYSSGKSIMTKCPDCGNKRLIMVSNLYKRGYSCTVCGKGYYTEKFTSNFLNQLLELQLIDEFSTQKTFNWGFIDLKNKKCKFRYDFYFKINNKTCIIETHGNQHYDGHGFNFGGGRTLEEEQENDRLKQELALKNGIDYYITLDCRKSELDWIKNSIIYSKLTSIVNFKEGEIDWLKCHKYACSSRVKEACVLWNGGIKNTKEVGKLMKLGKGTVEKYLRQGHDLEWCNYNPRRMKKIICLNTKEIFNGESSTCEFLKFKSKGCIVSCCNGKSKTAWKHPATGEPLKWMYLDDYNKMLEEKEQEKQIAI